MSWPARRLAAFDLETTGVAPECDRIVSAAVHLSGGGRPPLSYTWLVDPGIEIPAEAAAVHGITTARARACGDGPGAVVEALTTLLAAKVRAGVPIVAFNARFDLTVLDREARRHGVVPLTSRVGGVAGTAELLVVDPSVLDRHLDTEREGPRSLGATCAHYGVVLATPHDADADARAAAAVARRIAARFPDVAGSDLRLLHRRQAVWAAEQAAALEVAHGGGHIPRAWPLVPLPAAALAA